jgi:hypothetical protein
MNIKSAILGLCLLAMPISSHAAVYTMTFSGVVNAGISAIDTAGVFGPANSSLNGLSYQAVFTYDTNLGTHLTNICGNHCDILRGGSSFGQPARRRNETATLAA